MRKIIVLYYSSNGKTAELAKHVRSGILDEGNNEPLLRTVMPLSKNQLEPLLKDIHLIGGGGNIIHNLSVKNYVDSMRVT